MGHNLFNRLARVIVSCFIVFALFFSHNLISQTNEMDSILKKELGTEEPSDAKKPPPSAEKPTPDQPKNANPPLEKNPIEEKYRNSQKNSESSLLWVLLKIIIVFSILLAIMYYILKYISRNRIARYPVRDAMHVLASLPIGTNKEIQIIEIEGELLVLGVADGSINLLKEITIPEVKEKILLKREEHEPTSENFLEALMQNIKQNAGWPNQNNNQPVPGNQQDSFDDNMMNEIKQRQLDRLEKMKQQRDNLSKNEPEKGD